MDTFSARKIVKQQQGLVKGIDGDTETFGKASSGQKRLQ